MDFDYDKIRKICTNILSNAFKFTPNKGSISLDIAVRGTNLELTFTDTGCGIEDEAKEKIFQRFYQSGKNQSNNGGSGIGLHIVSEYVKMHQGTVCVRDNQPCGSVFLIALPLHQNSNETKNGEPVEGPEIKEESHPFTILLVDDNYDFLKFLSESLARQYHVLKATNGKHALNVLEKEDIDLVVSDIMMPEMDGLELCSTIKNDIRYSHIPIILLTAKASEEHQLEGLSVGADDYIMKPFDSKELVARVKAVLRRYQPVKVEEPAPELKCVKYPDLIVNLSNYSVIYKDNPIDMPPKELELLYFLASSPNQVFTREQLLDHIWGYEYIGDTRTVDVHVKRLREKIKDNDSWSLSTVWGIGYKFEVKNI